MGWLPTQLAQTVLSEENVCLERDCCSIEAILCMQFVNTSEKQSPSALIESDWIWSVDRPRQVGDEEEHDTEDRGLLEMGQLQNRSDSPLARQSMPVNGVRPNV